MPADDKYNGDESYTHPMIAMREAAEKQQEEEDTANLRKGLQSEIEKLEEQRRNVENLAHINSLCGFTPNVYAISFSLGSTMTVFRLVQP